MKPWRRAASEPFWSIHLHRSPRTCSPVPSACSASRLAHSLGRASRMKASTARERWCAGGPSDHPVVLCMVPPAGFGGRLAQPLLDQDVAPVDLALQGLQGGADGFTSPPPGRWRPASRNTAPCPDETRPGRVRSCRLSHERLRQLARSGRNERLVDEPQRQILGLRLGRGQRLVDPGTRDDDRRALPGRGRCGWRCRSDSSSSRRPSVSLLRQ